MPLAAFPKCFLDELVARQTMPVEEWIALAAPLKVDGLEFYHGFTPIGDPKRLRSLRQQMTGFDLAMPMMCASPDFTRPSAAERREEIEKQRRVMEATAELGGSLCRVLSGQRRPGLAASDGVQMAAECIQSLIPDAKTLGITLVLENHYKDGFWEWPELAQRMPVFLELLDIIPVSPWFGVNYDPSNALLAGDDPVELLQQVRHRLVSMHASDRYFEGGSIQDLRRIEQDPAKGYAPFLKHGVIGSGAIDYDAIFTILRSIHFRGWISIEDGDDPTVGIENLYQSVHFLRGKMKEYGVG